MQKERRRIDEIRRELEARARLLRSETEDWEPLDLNRYPFGPALKRELDRRFSFLWRSGVDAGALVVQLAALRALDAAPQVRSRALEAREALHRAADQTTFTYPHLGLAPIYSLDGLLFACFEHVCRLWALDGSPHEWERLREMGLWFAEVMEELAGHIRLRTRQAHPVGENQADATEETAA
jgi:hypothetical protein